MAERWSDVKGRLDMAERWRLMSVRVMSYTAVWGRLDYDGEVEAVVRLSDVIHIRFGGDWTMTKRWRMLSV